MKNKIHFVNFGEVDIWEYRKSVVALGAFNPLVFITHEREFGEELLAEIVEYCYYNNINIESFIEYIERSEEGILFTEKGEQLYESEYVTFYDNDANILAMSTLDISFYRIDANDLINCINLDYLKSSFEPIIVGGFRYFDKK